jgi:hypothetical protein
MHDAYSWAVGTWGGWIGLPAEALAALSAAGDGLPGERVEAERRALAAGEQPSSGTSPVLAALAAVLAIPAMVEHHRHQGLTEAISLATAADIALWITEHHRRHGAWGLTETGWIRNHLAGRLIRLGRLQFMLASCDLPLRAEDPLRVGDPVLEVHIPAGEPLRAEACGESFSEARQVFATREWRGFTCKSWLLATRLTEVLPATSNILAFQRLFQPLPCAMDDRQTIERVFGTWPLDPLQAPRSTALQRAILDFYGRGGRLPGGAGFIAR